MGMVYFGLNTLANDLQDPFGTDECDINLEGFSNQMREDFAAYEDHWGSQPGDDALIHMRLAHIHDYD
tara:strand:+ start:1222 stop:1425 length:204 start_codon:yes stop_codon:yes gene_type:complete